MTPKLPSLTMLVALLPVAPNEQKDWDEQFHAWAEHVRTKIVELTRVPGVELRVFGLAVDLVGNRNAVSKAHTLIDDDFSFIELSDVGQDEGEEKEDQS